MLAVTSRLKSIYLSYFANPPGDRPLFRAIQRRKIRGILELGVGTGQRALRMIELAARRLPPAEIHYTGIDLFESRSGSDRPGASLKTVYQLLARTGARVRLCPGDPFGVLSRTANSLPRAELVVICSELDPMSLSRAWFFLPRLLDSDSQVFVLEDAGSGESSTFRLLGRGEIDMLASTAAPRRAA